ncbi:hypothetical protein K491DRAFT_683874 [Lophiostoma macrostomum CBS 122681]|uniref:Uncharacterized protein n=1 Tax=Lophiostoma macrostomum CBS 122681 TaxID=1314788 RepID=A0A6A6SSP4_9PLEO|nr:hypothetical protein K491DRAFT_683874 [Lophiostoma macrostomum CBS 122681]
MRFQSVSVPFCYGLSLLPNVLANIVAHKIVLDNDPWGSPFKVAFSIADDLAIKFDISTETSDPSTLNSFPGSDGLNAVSREHQVGVTFHNSQNITEFVLGGWDINAQLELDQGLEATIRLATYWGYDSAPEVVEQQVVIDSTGPIFSHVVGHMNSTQGWPTRSGYCTGLDPGKRTFQPEQLNIHLTYSIGLAPYANVTAQTKGSIGARSAKAISLSSKLIAKDGCSRRYPICTADRTGGGRAIWRVDLQKFEIAEAMRSTRRTKHRWLSLRDVIFRKELGETYLVQNFCMFDSLLGLRISDNEIILNFQLNAINGSLVSFTFVLITDRISLGPRPQHALYEVPHRADSLLYHDILLSLCQTSVSPKELLLPIYSVHESMTNPSSLPSF